MAGWGVFYTALGIWWWPALVTGAIVSITAWRLGRTAAAVFASTIEATVDLHHRELTTALGIELPAHGRLTPVEGAIVNDQLNKGA